MPTPLTPPAGQRRPLVDPDVTPDPPRPATGGRNLMTIPLVAGILRSRWYPGIFQVPVAAVFGLVAYQLLAGPRPRHTTTPAPP